MTALRYAALLLALALPVAARAQTPVTLGVLADMSGPAMDMAGPGAVIATQMAVDDFGGSVLGRPIKVISADDQLKAELGSQIARRWYDTEGVDLILDVPVSSIGLAVQQVSREKQKLFITTSSQTADFTGKFCSPYSMQWDFNTTALVNGTARALVERGMKSWFFLTADYAFGISLANEAAKVVRANGGSVVGEVRHPFNAPDLTSFVLQARDSSAQVIGLADGPPDNMNAIRDAAEFGLAAAGKSLAGLFIVITDVHGAGLQATQGLLLTDSFYWDATDETRTWSRRFFAKHGKMPTSMQAADYSAALHYLKAVKAAGTTDPLPVAAKMREAPVDDVFTHGGTLRIDGLMVHDLLLLQVKTPAESKAPWDYYTILSRIPANQAFPPLKGEGCPLVKD